MNIRSLALLFVLVLDLVVFSRPAAAIPPAPTPLGPANGASVLVPSTISWSAVTDSTGAGIIAYNWKLSRSSSLTPVILMDSISGTTTQDTVSGLVPGTYFWQVQGVNSAGQQGDWSAIRSFTVTGAGPGTPGTPVLAPQPYSTFHPFETVQFNWSAVPNAPTYRLEVSNDPNFPLGTVPPGIVTFWNDNIRATTDGFVTHPSLGEGIFFARVFATDSDFAGGIRSLPSNVIQYTVFYNNPVQQPPTPLSPINNPTLTLPITLTWTDMLIPQPMGYDGQISSSPSFSTNEAPLFVQLSDPAFNILSLTPGTKFWRVRSTQGHRTPDLPAFTAYSVSGSFTISSAPATVVSVAPVGLAAGLPPVLYSGTSGFVRVQLTAAVSAGVAVALASSHPILAPVPSTIMVPGNSALAEFPVTVGQVTSATVVTLTATLNGVSTSSQFTLRPPTLNDDPLQSLTQATGGATMIGWVNLEAGGLAAPGGFVVNLSTDSPAASVPTTVTIAAGFPGVGFQINTAPVTTTTVVRITASAGGVTTQWPITLTPAPAPASFFVRPLSTTNGSQGIVTAAPAGIDEFMQVTSSNPALATVPTVVNVSAGSGLGRFNITTAPVTQPTTVTISVSGGGVTLSSPLTLYPTLPTLTAITVNPTSVVGGTPSTGTVRLSTAAPAGGVAVNIETQLPLTASVPASVIIPGGATSASFTVTTFPSATTSLQLTATLGSVTQFTSITVTPPPVGPTISAVSLSQTSVVGGNSITVTVRLSAPAPTGGAVVSLSDNSSATAVPASVTVAAGATTATFTVTTSAVTTSTSATIAAVYAGVTQTVALTVNPVAGPPPPPVPAAPSLISPASRDTVAQPVTFDWSDVANAATYEIQIDDFSTITAPFLASQIVNVSQVTIAGLPAQRLWWRVRAINASGVAGLFSSTQSFTAQAAAAASLSAVSVNPASVVGGISSTGTVTLTGAAPSGGAVVTLSSNNMSVAGVPASVMVAAGATSATFTVTTTAVIANASATLTGAYNTVSRTATFTVTPVLSPASLNAVTLNPASVTGGTTSQGTVTLTSAAPSGGLVVSLASDAGAATVPASVTVAAGATSATFTITTTTVTTATTVTVTGSSGGAVRAALLTVNPPGQSVTLTVTASGRSGERVTSSPAGINVTVGSTGSAGFTSGTAITLSVTNGRDAIWSGACSSGGNKAKTCTFTITGTGTVIGNVQ